MTSNLNRRRILSNILVLDKNLPRYKKRAVGVTLDDCKTTKDLGEYFKWHLSHAARSGQRPHLNFTSLDPKFAYETIVQLLGDNQIGTFSKYVTTEEQTVSALNSAKQAPVGSVVVIGSQMTATASYGQDSKDPNTFAFTTTSLAAYKLQSGAPNHSLIVVTAEPVQANVFLRVLGFAPRPFNFDALDYAPFLVERVEEQFFRKLNEHLSDSSGRDEEEDFMQIFGAATLDEAYEKLSELSAKMVKASKSSITNVDSWEQEVAEAFTEAISVTNGVKTIDPQKALQASRKRSQQRISDNAKSVGDESSLLIPMTFRPANVPEDEPGLRNLINQVSHMRTSDEEEPDFVIEDDDDDDFSLPNRTTALAPTTPSASLVPASETAEIPKVHGVFVLAGQAGTDRDNAITVLWQMLGIEEWTAWRLETQSLVSKFVGDSELAVRAACRQMQKLSRALILIPEDSNIIQASVEGSGGAGNEVVVQMINNMKELFCSWLLRNANSTFKEQEIVLLIVASNTGTIDRKIWDVCQVITFGFPHPLSLGERLRTIGTYDPKVAKKGSPEDFAFTTLQLLFDPEEIAWDIVQAEASQTYSNDQINEEGGMACVARPSDLVKVWNALVGQIAAELRQQNSGLNLIRRQFRGEERMKHMKRYIAPMLHEAIHSVGYMPLGAATAKNIQAGRDEWLQPLQQQREAYGYPTKGSGYYPWAAYHNPNLRIHSEEFDPNRFTGYVPVTTDEIARLNRVNVHRPTQLGEGDFQQQQHGTKHQIVVPPLVDIHKPHA